MVLNNLKESSILAFQTHPAPVLPTAAKILQLVGNTNFIEQIFAKYSYFCKQIVKGLADWLGSPCRPEIPEGETSEVGEKVINHCSSFQKIV